MGEELEAEAAERVGRPPNAARARRGPKASTTGRHDVTSAAASFRSASTADERAS